jgi:hypothetical protein
MKGNRAVLTAVVIVALLVAGWFMFRRSGGAAAIDLLSTFATAEKRPASGTFEVVDADLNGEKKRAIFTVPASRITWKVRVPDDAWLKVWMGMKPESWEKEGDGVLFRVGVSDGRAYDELFTQHVDPFTNKGDRRWIPTTVDLSAYAGEEVDIIFNTNTSPKGKGDDPRNDLALWGAPEIVIR